MNTVRQTTDHSWHSNFRFVLRKVWLWDPVLLGCILSFALCSVISPYIAITLPKQLIDTLSPVINSNIAQAFEEVLHIVGFTALGLLCANAGIVMFRSVVHSKASMFRNRLSLQCDYKATSIEYGIAQSAEGRQALYQSSVATNDNDSGGEAIIVHGANWVSHGLGLGLYCYLLGHVNIALIALFLAVEIIGIVGMYFAQSYEQSQQSTEIETGRKRATVEHQATDFAFAKDIRLFAMQAWLSQRHGRHIEALQNIKEKTQKRHLAANVVRSAIAAIRDYLAYGYLASQVLQGNLSAGEFTMQFSAVVGISTWLHLLAQDTLKVRRALEQIGFLRFYLSLPDTSTVALLDAKGTTLEQTQGTNARKAALSAGTFAVEFDHVTFRYSGSETDVLSDFSLRIAAGEKVALVGLNGAGKTTCVQLLTGLYRPTTGKILLGGMDSRLFSSQELFALFGAVFQEARVLATDIRQNVALCLEEDIDDERVLHCLKRAGLQDKVDSLREGVATQLTKLLFSEGIELSGGENQKLMLARALYKNAPFLVLDEPTAALDPIAEHAVYQSYAELTAERSSLFISHRLASTRFCDRIALLEHGRVAELGSHDELLKLRGSYAQLFELQSEYYQSEEVKEHE